MIILRLSNNYILKIINMEKENCIFISINKNFLNHLRLCLLSIKINFPNYPDIILYHTDLNDNDIISLYKISNKIIPIKNNLKDEESGPIMNHLKNINDHSVFYARFQIWNNPIFKNYNNVLHLDADTIVLNDLSELMNNRDFYIMQDVYEGEDKIFNNNTDINLLKCLKKDKINIWNLACNGWIFLVPQKYRTVQFYKQLMKILNNYKNYIKWADQSVLNVRLYKNNISIQKDLKYNYQHRLLLKSELKKDKHKIWIVHFNGISDLYRIKCMERFLNLSLEDWDLFEKYLSYFNWLNINE